MAIQTYNPHGAREQDLGVVPHDQAPKTGTSYRARYTTPLYTVTRLEDVAEGFVRIWGTSTRVRETVQAAQEYILYLLNAGCCSSEHICQEVAEYYGFAPSTAYELILQVAPQCTI